jgi:hypothetical protein
MRAMASSVPGSVSKMIFFVAEAGRARKSRNAMTIEDLGMFFLLGWSSEVG